MSTLFTHTTFNLDIYSLLALILLIAVLTYSIVMSNRFKKREKHLKDLLGEDDNTDETI